MPPALSTNQDGTISIGNTADGIRLEGGSIDNNIGGSSLTAGANVVSGNGQHGVIITSIDTDDNTISFNLIGLNKAGTAALANGESGVILSGSTDRNNIDGNVISGNTKYGVHVTGIGTNGNIIKGNYIGTDITGSVAVIHSVVFGWMQVPTLLSLAGIAP